MLATPLAEVSSRRRPVTLPAHKYLTRADRGAMAHFCIDHFSLCIADGLKLFSIECVRLYSLYSVHM